MAAQCLQQPQVLEKVHTNVGMCGASLNYMVVEEKAKTAEGCSKHTLIVPSRQGGEAGTRKRLTD